MGEQVWLPTVANCRFIASVFMGISVYLLSRKGDSYKILTACGELSGYLTKKGKNTSWYQKRTAVLLKNGAAFHFGKGIQPAGFLALSFLLAGIGFALGVQINLLSGILFAFAGLGAPEWMMKYLNYRDNERMLSEIKLIYNGLEMQLQAGVYVTDALAECYAGVQEVRLRQALLDLAGAVTVNADVYEALNEFQKRFNNRYIDAMCITLIQALESGQAVELLHDIAEQVKDMEVSVMGRRRAALDRSITFYQLGILGTVLGIVVYACVTQLFTAALTF